MTPLRHQIKIIMTTLGVDRLYHLELVIPNEAITRIISYSEVV